MLMIDVGAIKHTDMLAREFMDINTCELDLSQKATLQSAFEVYTRSLIMLERTEAAMSSRAWSVASMVIAAVALLLLSVPSHIILVMVISAEILGVVIGRATKRAVLKGIQESQSRLREEIKNIQQSNCASSSSGEKLEESELPV